MKTYKNHCSNLQERKRLEQGGCHHIKIANGEIISYINGKGERITKKVAN